MKKTGYYIESLYIFASTSTFRLHSAIKNHCQIIFYANRSSTVSYFMNFWTEKNMQWMKSTYVQHLFPSHNSCPKEKHKHETSIDFCILHAILCIHFINNQLKCIIHWHQTTWENTVCHWILQFSISLLKEDQIPMNMLQQEIVHLTVCQGALTYWRLVLAMNFIRRNSSRNLQQRSWHTPDCT